MKRALEMANALRDSGVIGSYAIVGSIAIIYYASPINTDDLDIFFLHGTPQSELFSMQKIYDFLVAQGFEPKDYTVNIAGVKVQFVPSTGPLSDEAILNAVDATVFGVDTKIATPEYLIAMKLTAGRPKDYAHIAHLLENSRLPIDFNRLDDLLSRFQLQEAWNRFVGKGIWKSKS